MKSIPAEKGTVKLVHPGRQVEILREPVTAAEVMSKNPRHCITRPDVFKFPWVVMKPESVLPPGKVFFLVPNRTVYDLMKAEKHRNPPLPWWRQRQVQRRSPKTTPSPSSPPKAYAGNTPKHLQSRRHQHSHIPPLTFPTNDTSYDSTTSSRSHQLEQDHLEERFPTPWAEHRNTYREFRRWLESETSTEVETTVTSGGEVNGYSTGRAGDVIEEQAGVAANGSGQGQSQGREALKSCMRKAESARKSLGLRVSFVLPLPSRDEQQRQNRAGAWRLQGRTRFSDS